MTGVDGGFKTDRRLTLGRTAALVKYDHQDRRHGPVTIRQKLL